MSRIINRLYRALPHAAIILSLMFIVFLILDVYNPLMQFVDNGMSRVLLGLLAIASITTAGLLIRCQRKGRD